MTQREQVIVDMLRLRSQVMFGDMAGVRGGRDGSYSLEYGPDFSAAFRELERLLDVMRGERPKQRRHVMARYCECDRRPLEVPFTRTKRHGAVSFAFKLPAHTELVNDKAAPSVLDDKTARVLVYQWPAWVKLQEADKGVAWLAQQFQGVPAVPVDREAIAA